MNYSIVIKKCFSKKSQNSETSLISEIEFLYECESDGIVASIPCLLNFENNLDSERIAADNVTQDKLEKMIALKLDVKELDSELQNMIEKQKSEAQQEVVLQGA